MRKVITILLVVILVISGFTTNVSAATIKLNKTKKTIYIGDTYKLKLKNVPSDAKITWKSSDESIATVNSSGKVTAVKKGKATITATYNKKDYQCKITVKKQKQSGNTDFSKAKTGDIITFGSYEQDNNLDNGKEPIEWIVLEKTKSALFVVSKYALDTMPYNLEYKGVTWETCTLRKWLNDNFYNAAFNKDEKALIKTTTVENFDNPEYKTPGGNDTKDKIFLLSQLEMIDSDYGFSEAYETYDVNRRCAATAYAIARGSSNYKTIGGEEACEWWLRSPGGVADYAALVYNDGFVSTGGSRVGDDDDGYGVRPAMVIKLK